LPPSLAPHEVYTAANAADAALFGADLLGVHRVSVKSADARAFVATYHAVSLDAVTVGYLDYGTDVEVEIREPTDHLLVLVPTTGSSQVDFDGIEVRTSPVHAVIVPASTPFRIRCDRNAAHFVVRFHRNAVTRHLTRVLGRPVDTLPRFEPRFDLTAEAATRWNTTIQLINTELQVPESLLSTGRGTAALEEFLLNALLYSQMSDLADELELERPSERPTVTRAREFILARLTEPIAIDDVAAAAGVGVRTLQQHFREDLGVTPSTYLRDMRLDRIRDELAASANRGTTVADVAARWGLTHLGRFSAAYRKRFGELPSQTLRA
jgi:AraC-like DNA-binding protein